MDSGFLALVTKDVHEHSFRKAPSGVGAGTVLDSRLSTLSRTSVSHESAESHLGLWYSPGSRVHGFNSFHSGDGELIL